MEKFIKIKKVFSDEKLRERHMVRFFGGVGTVSLIYVSLRFMEKDGPALAFIVWYSLVSYFIGWLMDRRYE